MASLLAFLKEKNAYYLPKSEKLRAAFLKYLKEISTTSTCFITSSVQDKFTERADKFLQSTLGQKDATLKDYWDNYAKYLTFMLIIAGQYFPYSPVDLSLLLKIIAIATGSSTLCSDCRFYCALWLDPVTRSKLHLQHIEHVSKECTNTRRRLYEDSDTSTRKPRNSSIHLEFSNNGQPDKDAHSRTSSRHAG